MTTRVMASDDGGVWCVVVDNGRWPSSGKSNENVFYASIGPSEDVMYASGAAQRLLIVSNGRQN